MFSNEKIWDRVDFPALTKQFLNTLRIKFSVPFGMCLSTFLGIMATICQNKFVVETPLLLNAEPAICQLNLFTVVFHNDEQYAHYLYKTLIDPIDSYIKHNNSLNDTVGIYSNQISHKEILDFFRTSSYPVLSILNANSTFDKQIYKNKNLLTWLINGYDNIPSRLYDNNIHKFRNFNPLISLSFYIPFSKYRYYNFINCQEFSKRCISFITSYLSTGLSTHIDIDDDYNRYINQWMDIYKIYTSSIYTLLDCRKNLLTNNIITKLTLSDKAKSLYYHFLTNYHYDHDAFIHLRKFWRFFPCDQILKIAALIFLFENYDKIDNIRSIDSNYLKIALDIINICGRNNFFLIRTFNNLSTAINPKKLKKCKDIVLNKMGNFPQPFSKRDLIRKSKYSSEDIDRIIEKLKELNIIKECIAINKKSGRGRPCGPRYELSWPTPK